MISDLEASMKRIQMWLSRDHSRGTSWLRQEVGTALKTSVKISPQLNKDIELLLCELRELIVIVAENPRLAMLRHVDAIADIVRKS